MQKTEKITTFINSKLYKIKKVRRSSHPLQRRGRLVGNQIRGRKPLHTVDTYLCNSSIFLLICWMCCTNKYYYFSIGVSESVAAPFGGKHCTFLICSNLPGDPAMKVLGSAPPLSSSYLSALSSLYTGFDYSVTIAIENQGYVMVFQNG